MRPFTFPEWFRFTLAAARVRDTVDRDLGLLLLRVASGDDTALVPASDRLEELGDFAGAGRIRRLLEE